MYLFGSICLSDIPDEVKKRVSTRNGEKVYVNILVGERKRPAVFGSRTYTHFITCAPRQEERREDVNYFIGDLTDGGQRASVDRQQGRENFPPQEDNDLPF